MSQELTNLISTYFLLFLNIFVFAYHLFCSYLNPWLITSVNLCHHPQSLAPLIQLHQSCYLPGNFSYTTGQVRININICQCHIHNVSQQAFFALLVISSLYLSSNFQTGPLSIANYTVMGSFHSHPISLSTSFQLI